MLKMTTPLTSLEHSVKATGGLYLKGSVMNAPNVPNTSPAQ